MILFKNSSAIIRTHPWNTTLHVLLIYMTLLVLTCYSSNSVSASRVSYAYHCGSFVPELTRERLLHSGALPASFQRHGGHYITAESGVSRTRSTLELSNSLVFYLRLAYETDVQGLFSVEAKLKLFTSRTYFYEKNSSNYYSNSMYQFRPGDSSGRINVFRLHGFWSQSHGKLCGVGEGYYRRPKGESDIIPVSLRLYNLYNSTNLTSLVAGSLEELVGSDQKHFDFISVMLFPKMNYEYTLVEKALVDDVSTTSVSESDVGLAWDSMISSVCSLIFSRLWSLKYSSRCRNTSSAKSCSPLGESLGQLPDSVMLRKIECSEYGQRLRLLIKFPTSESDIWSLRYLDPKVTLVGEGIWDSRKNQLLVVACRFLNATDSWAEAQVTDCSTRLSLRFPAIWTIDNTISVVGRLWSTKTATDSGYFDEIKIHHSEGLLAGSPHMKYEYTKIDKAKKWCPRKEPAKSRDKKTYPDAFSFDMRFDVLSSAKITTGYLEPISVGNQFYGKQWLRKNFSNSSFSDAEPPEDMSTVSSVDYPTNMSYLITLFNVSREFNSRFDISAEGTYDGTTGSLCMVGCRHIGLSSSNLSSFDDDILDCEILVNFQFPPSDSMVNAGFIKGSIESRRNNSDPLHFAPLKLSAAAYVTIQAQESIWTTNWEIILALVSNTLACVFAVCQIFYLRKYPVLLPFVSLTMLWTLIFGYTIPLVMDLKSLLMTTFKSQDVLLGSGGWLEAKGVTEGVSVLMLFLSHARLLQLTWSARLCHENQAALRIAETEALVVSLPLYFGGAFLSVFFTGSKRNRDLATLSSTLITSYYENPIWEALKSYAKVLSDGFLLPQIFLNVFRGSTEKALSCFFYIGITLVRLLPHAYGLYKAQNSGLKLVSTVWDVIIPFGSLLFAAIVYLQQNFGGRCILPFSIRKSNVHEKVTKASETET